MYLVFVFFLIMKLFNRWDILPILIIFLDKIIANFIYKIL
jgi:hypothetical protein